MKTVKLKVTGMHCTSCPIMIDGTLEDTFDAVVSAQTNYAKQICIVEYDENKTQVEALIKAVEKLGYKAECN